MNEHQTILKLRKQNIQKLYSQGIPKLCCPPLTHYSSGGDIDFSRMEHHLNHMAPYINSWLIPGSTGDGWEINFEEYKQILHFVFEEMQIACDVNILIGLLRLKLEDTLQFMDYAIEYLDSLGLSLEMKTYQASKFKGFVICPPEGENLSEKKIEEALTTILDRGYPTVLYQLPQITNNEMQPSLVSKLAEKYSNLYMLKDSSGQDKVAKANQDYFGLTLLRGAEEDYSRHLQNSGGHYDGFLLSTGNTFAKELHYIVSQVLKGNQEQAEKESSQLSQVIKKVFNIAQKIPYGNAFTNANKLLDHIMAYGESWSKYPAPRLHAGETLSTDLLKKVDSILKKSPYYPQKGYLET